MGLIVQLTALGIIVGAIIGLFAHHALTHDGVPYQANDFIDALTGLFSSHEGVIILLSLIMIGVFIG